MQLNDRYIMYLNSYRKNDGVFQSLASRRGDDPGDVAAWLMDKKACVYLYSGYEFNTCQKVSR